MKHIIYIPGLGDRYDGIRKLGLRLWRGPAIRVSHHAMNWQDSQETFDQKLDRLRVVIEHYPDDDVVLVGESAGGSAAIVAMDRFKKDVARVVTLCGMNHGAGAVNPRLYMKNPAFKEAMKTVDQVLPRLDADTKANIFTIYSSSDYTVRPKNSLIAGVVAYDLKITGHMFAILAVLFVRHSLVTGWPDETA